MAIRKEPVYPQIDAQVRNEFQETLDRHLSEVMMRDAQIAHIKSRIVEGILILIALVCFAGFGWMLIQNVPTYLSSPCGKPILVGGILLILFILWSGRKKKSED